MRDFLLSVASPNTLSWIGFLMLAAGLLGEVAVLTSPLDQHWSHKPLGFLFAVIVLAGYVVGHIGDDESFKIVSDRATAAEGELKRITSPRTISDKQHAALVTCLNDAPKGTVYIRPGMVDPNGIFLAEQLEKIFKEAGFNPAQWPEGFL